MAPTNWGWNAYEGTACDTCDYPGVCPFVLSDLQAPFRSYSIGAGRSVISGYAYRGCRMPDLQGTYFYSDFFNSAIFTLRTNGSCSVTAAPDTNRASDLDPAGALAISTISSFGEDNQGEMYIIDQNGGEVFKIIPDMAIMELSGPGATPLTFNANGELEWEDLPESSDMPVSRYKVYRSTAPTGTFSCVLLQVSTSTTWVGGDLDPIGDLEIFHYLVTALGAASSESTAGTESDGTPRVVDTASACP